MGNLAFKGKDIKNAQKIYEEALTLNRECGDDRSIVHSLNGGEKVAIELRNHEQTQKFHEESAALSCGNEWVAL